MKEKKHFPVKLLIESILAAAALVLCFLLLGGTVCESTGQTVLVISDSLTIVGLLYFSLGLLFWVSSTGFFDIFGYTAVRVLGTFIPGLGGMSASARTDFYEYKEEKKLSRDRKKGSMKTTLFIGAVILVLAVIATVVWYRVGGEKI